MIRLSCYTIVPPRPIDDLFCCLGLHLIFVSSETKAIFAADIFPRFDARLLLLAALSISPFHLRVLGS